LLRNELNVRWPWPEEAVAELEQDVQASPRAHESYYLLGQLHVQLNDYDNAIASYRSALEIAPDSTRACYGLAMAYARLGQQETAQRQMERFRKLKAKDVQHDKDRRSDYDDMKSSRRRAAATYTAAGTIYYGHGHLHKAEKLWRRAARLDLKNVVCRAALATVYQRGNRVEEALEVCEQLQELEPKNPIRYLNTGVLNARLKRFDAAERAFDRVCELAPQHSVGYRMLAQMKLDAGGNMDEALELAQKAVELEPIAQNYFVLGVVRNKRGDLPGANAALKRAMAMEPGNPNIRRVYDAFQKRLRREN